MATLIVKLLVTPISELTWFVIVIVRECCIAVDVACCVWVCDGLCRSRGIVVWAFHG